MPNESDSRYTVKLEVKPDRVVSNGTDEVVLKCTIGDGGKKAPKEDIPVTLIVKRQRLREEKTARKGAVTFKFKPARPSGKTQIICETPHGSESINIFVNPTPVQYIRDLLWSIVLAFIIAFGIIRPFILQTFYIPSGSMEPALYQGDRLVGLMFPLRFRDPVPGEVVIFTRPGEIENKQLPLIHIKYKTQTKFIKRVIALGGDTIEVNYHTLYVNGKPLDEPFTKDLYLNNDMPPYKVPAGRVFLMGDNRNNSNDARFWGTDENGNRVPQALEKKRIMSKAVFRFWPPDRMGLIKTIPRKYK